MFQFPAAPAVGQVFGPIPGVNYKWNGTGWVPFATVMGGISVSGQALFADGTLAAPGISWINEPTMGWIRAGANTTQWVVNGVATLGLTPSYLSTTVPLLITPGTGAAPAFTFNTDPTTGMWLAAPGDLRLSISGVFKAQFAAGGMGYAGSITASTIMQAPCVAATGAFGVATQPAGSACLYAGGMSVRGNAANLYGPVQLNATDGIGGTNVYQWVQSPSSSLGSHTFGSLNGSGFLQIMGGAYGTAAGVTFQVVNASVIPLTGIDMVQDVNSGTIKFTIRRNGTFSNVGGDFVMGGGQIGSFQPQFKINGGYSASLAPGNVVLAPLSIVTSSGFIPALHLTDSVTGAWIFAMSGNTLLWGAQSAPGPLSGYAMQLQQHGPLAAGAYTNASDEVLKTDIAAITGALARMLQLHGIRYKQTWDGAMMMGLTAQDVEPVFPELVGEAGGIPNDGVPTPKIKTLNYIGLIAPMIEAMRELDARLTALGG